MPLFRSKVSHPDRSIRTFTWIWLSPGLLLFTFVYLKFVNSGYLLVLFPPVCVWLGFRAASWYDTSSWPTVMKVVLLLIAAAINSALFFRAPLYFSYREVRRSEQELITILASIRRIANPQNTIIVGFDSHFLGYRHAGYYLPEYLTILYPEVPLASTSGVFAMRDQGTRLVSRLSIGSARTFLLFPLPASDKEYRDYMQQVRARFPPGTLHVTVLSGHEFLTGPVSALPVLFPSTAGHGLLGEPAPSTP